MKTVIPETFDAAELADGIIGWARMESPSFERARVDALVAHVAKILSGHGATVERHRLSDLHADPATARFGPAGPGGTLILGHLDTVHPVGSAEEGPLRIRIEDDRLFGPGVFDMKGGLYIAYAAVRELLSTGWRPARPLTFLLVTDEELGSPASRRLIEDVAARHANVLVPEPARLGKAITGRHAFARFVLTTRGKPAHAGADNAVGRSAIRAMARLVDRIEGATDLQRLVSFSVGVIGGGRFVNVVPTECRAEVLAVASSHDNLAFVREFMATLTSPIEGVELDVEPGPERPLFSPHPGTMALYRCARAIAADIGFTLDHGQFGGGSDGNFTGALGLPTLDGLGVCGAGAHTQEEHLSLPSLVPRAKLIAGLVAALDRG